MDTSDGVFIKSIINDILCAKKNNLSEIDVSGYKKLEQQNPGVFWASDLPGVGYIGHFETTLKYASSQSKNILAINVIKQTDNRVIIGDDVNCKLQVTIRRNLNPSATDAEKLTEYINSGIDGKIESLLSELDSKTGSAFAIAFSIIPECYHSNLSVKRRAEYINKLANFNDNYLSLIRSLIRTCPPEPNEVDSFFIELSAKPGFKNLLTQRNRFTSRDNYNALNRDLVMLYYKQTKDDIAILPDNSFIWLEGLLTSLDYNSSYQASNQKIKFTWQTVRQTESGLPMYGNMLYKEVDPFATINVNFHTSIRFVGVTGVFPMPAFMFHWIIKEKQSRELDTAIDISIFALSFVFTITEIAHANRTWKVIVGIAELIYSSGDLFFTLSPSTVEMLDQTTIGQNFLRLWDATGKILDIKTISESAINNSFPLLLSFAKAWEQLKEENSNLEDLIGQSEFAKCEKVYQLVK